MSKLGDSLKKLYADNFAFYLKAHGFHVNVESTKFHMYHAQFGDIYGYYEDQIDVVAELIRQAYEVTPASLARISKLTSVKDEQVVPEAKDMIDILYKDLEIVKQSAINAYNECQKEGEFGIQNAIAAYLEQTGKFCWQLRVTMESEAERREERAEEAMNPMPEEPRPTI